MSAFKESWLKNTSLGMWQASWQSEVSKECYLTKNDEGQTIFSVVVGWGWKFLKEKKFYFAKVNKNGYVVYR